MGSWRPRSTAYKAPPCPNKFSNNFKKGKIQSTMKALEFKIPPLILLIVFAAIMWSLTFIFPALSIPFPFSEMVAGSFFLLGAFVALSGVAAFQKANTTVDPRFPEKSSCLVTGGVYRISRNPMYLGFLLMLCGWSIWLMNFLAFLLLPLFVIYINRFQIEPEERHMAAKFGAEFHVYMTQVRRWI